VKVKFEHAGGASAPVTTAVLQSTTLTPKIPPTDVNYFPIAKGKTFVYRWTNTKHFKAPVVEKVTVAAVWSKTVSLGIGTHVLTATQTLVAGVTSDPSLAATVVVPRR
jgi:hypothetical protein